MEYVAGFMFSEDETKVALIQKNKPEWQKGKLNGIGGKIEKNEFPFQAMIREFEEETGLKTNEEEWNLYCTIHGDDLSNGTMWKVHFFYSFGDLEQLKTTTEEQIKIYHVDDACFSTQVPVINNLKWLIPMALYMNREKVDTFYDIEQFQND